MTSLADAIRRGSQLAHLPVGVFVDDPAGERVWANGRHAELVGVAEEDALGQGWRRHLALADEEVERACADSRAAGVSHERPCTFRLPDGRVNEVLAVSTPWRDGSGALVGWVGAFYTPNVCAVTRSAFPRLCAVSSEMLAVMRPDGVVVQASPRWASVVDGPGVELVNRSLLDLVHPDERADTEQAFSGATQFATPRQLTVRLRSGSDAWRPVALTVAAGPEDALGPLLFVAGRDLSEAVEMDKQLRLHAAVFEHALEGLVVVSGEGRIVMVNRAFEEITGYTAAEAVGKAPRMLRSGRKDIGFFDEIAARLREEGRWQGEVWNRRKNGEMYPQWLNVGAARDDSGVITYYVALFSDVTALRSSELRLERLAHYDPLTGLANRTLLFSRLEHALTQARRGDNSVAVLFLDLDRFKNINDSLGHPVGDELLISLVRRLQPRIRGGDTFARLGGDEFVVVMEGIRDATDAGQLAATLSELLQEPFELRGGVLIYATVSVGISVFPDNGSDAASLIRNADAAMYNAKESGRGTFRYYNASLTEAANQRLDLDTKLRRALERDEFLLHYQAKLDANGNIVGAEALVRWQLPDGPLVPPNRFIPVAEDTGLIIPLGEWVLREACREARRWIDLGYANIGVAVNVSNVQFRSRHLVERVKGILQETGLPAELLELEITESSILEPQTDAFAHLRGLRALGVRLSLDDFGTGYSSLTALKRLPLHLLKIDQSFVRGLPDDHNDAQIVRTIVKMAQNLGLAPLAEGVETAEQFAFLRELGCEYYQGYFFGRPEAAPAFRERLARAVTDSRRPR